MLKLLDMLFVLGSGIIVLALSAVALFRLFKGGTLPPLAWGSPESWKRWIFDEKPKPK